MNRLILALVFFCALASLAPVSGQVAAFDCFPLDGNQEVPPVPTAGTGLGNAWFDPVTAVFSWNISWSGLTGAVTAAHFHGPAAPGVNAGVQISIGTANPNVGSAVLTAAQQAALLAGQWYVNVHSTSFPGGEIRGQVVNTGCVRSFESYPINSAQEVPPNASTGTGLGSSWLNLNNRRLQWHIVFGGLTSAATAAHFHGPAAPGVNAGVQVNLGVANPNVSATVLSAMQVSQISAGLWYYNLHTAMFPGGELRGQVVNVGQPQWTAVGSGKPGLTGRPALVGVGPLTSGSVNQADLLNARPFSPTTLLVGFSALNLPFKGGTLVPAVDVLFTGLFTDANGGLSLAFAWPVGVPPGVNVWMQHWIQDPSAHDGLSSSNGLRLTAQ